MLATPRLEELALLLSLFCGTSKNTAMHVKFLDRQKHSATREEKLCFLHLPYQAQASHFPHNAPSLVTQVSGKQGALGFPSLTFTECCVRVGLLSKLVFCHTHTQ